MRFALASLIAVGFVVATAATGFAKPAEGRSEHGKRGEEFRAKMLEKFDADGDGTLSDEEKATARQEFAARRGEGRPGPERRPGAQERPSREEVMKKFDKDGDGELNEEERGALHEAMRARFGNRGPGGPEGRFGGPRGEEFRKRMLEDFDKDGDGELNEEERQAARAAMEERMKARREEMMKKFDKDGDGELNEEERKALREEFGHRPGGPEGGRGPEGARRRGPEGAGPGGRGAEGGGPRRGGPEGRGPRGGGPEGGRGPIGGGDNPL